MRSFIISAIVILVLGLNSTAQNSIGEDLEKEFKEKAQSFQSSYTGGSENCEEIINSMDPDIRMSELRFSEESKVYTYEQLVQFCPHLPRKEVIQTSTEQRLFSENFGYDYVSQLYLRKSQGDTLRETSSRIWENKNGKWRIIHMNNSINKACD